MTTVVRPRKATIDAELAAPEGLPAGRWRCVLKAGGKVVAEAAARIG